NGDEERLAEGREEGEQKAARNPACVLAQELEKRHVLLPSGSRGGWLAAVPEPVRNGIPSVAAKILLRDLHAGCGLPALVFSHIKQMLDPIDRKSTRLNSSHVKISYADFCVKKKKK